ncbi:MAG: response regulator, partial [Pseudolabrys sp.]
MTTSVLIVDDHPILLQGCRRILEDIGVERIFEAQNIATGYRQFLRHNPKMVLVDLSFQGNGLAGLALVER